MSTASTASRVVVNEELYPLVIIELHGQIDDEQFREYLRKLDALVPRPEKRVIFYDLRAGKNLTYEQRQWQAEWQKKNAEAVRQMNLGVAFVIDNPLLRVIVRAVLFIQPIGCPSQIFGSVEEAYRWSCDLLEKDGNPAAAARARARLGVGSPPAVPAR
ncbi:STAS/SEC14 domain-containing protein [Aggregicoccus sp. 17bor-14]|uniref:STAS/SEC14 domain-containing protein n=1 Tax=Myxococcaceae TaxID=31 RepID=UPI00129C38AE|nr:MULTISPECIES: STAS/SEC14 domain-containing protein [Myxococcaceae]MBF5045211.1 STAS/SEC14 domain-containing protein [Simulacricoccus sp. 17bor-14]MRI90952.1 STAS/SEC14 domain-containing protein [Aggregicoccus sp. 17bor-14]